MPAYNPPPQALFSPVSNFYQGKAIRQGLTAGEQDAELRDLQIEATQQEIDSAPDKQDAANREEQRKIDAAKRAAQKLQMEIGQDNTRILGEGAAAYTMAVEEGASPEESSQVFWSSLTNSGLSDEAVSQYKATYDKDGDGIINAEEAPDIRRFAMAVGGMEDDKVSPTTHQKNIDSLVSAGAITRDQGNEMLKNIEVKAGTVTGTTEFDPKDPRSASQKGAAYQANLESYNTSSDVQEMISNALPQVIDMPGTVGIKGSIGQGGAGLLASLGQDEMSDAFSQWMSGATPEDIAQIQTQLQAIRGRIIPIVTGEQGKRLSETEREIASRAVGLIEGIKGPADLTKSYPQVLGAMRQLYAESWATKFRLASRDENFQYPYDLSNKEQRIELYTEFSDAGVDVGTAKRTMVRLKSIQGTD